MDRIEIGMQALNEKVLAVTTPLKDCRYAYIAASRQALDDEGCNWTLDIVPLSDHCRDCIALVSSEIHRLKCLFQSRADVVAGVRAGVRRERAAAPGRGG